jgi:hypothetical protein
LNVMKALASVRRSKEDLERLKQADDESKELDMQYLLLSQAAVNASPEDELLPGWFPEVAIGKTRHHLLLSKLFIRREHGQVVEVSGPCRPLSPGNLHKALSLMLRVHNVTLNWTSSGFLTHCFWRVCPGDAQNRGLDESRVNCLLTRKGLVLSATEARALEVA